MDHGREMRLAKVLFLDGGGAFVRFRQWHAVMAIAFEKLAKRSQIPRTLSGYEPSQTRFSYFWRKFLKSARVPE